MIFLAQAVTTGSGAKDKISKAIMDVLTPEYIFPDLSGMADIVYNYFAIVAFGILVGVLANTMAKKDGVQDMFHSAMKVFMAMGAIASLSFIFALVTDVADAMAEGIMKGTKLNIEERITTLSKKLIPAEDGVNKAPPGTAPPAKTETGMGTAVKNALTSGLAMLGKTAGALGDLSNVSVGSIFVQILAAFKAFAISIMGAIAGGIMYFSAVILKIMKLLQYFISILSYGFAPLFVAGMLTSWLGSQSKTFFLSVVGVQLWGVGFALGNIGMSAIINMTTGLIDTISSIYGTASSTTSNQVIGSTADAFMGLGASFATLWVVLFCSILMFKWAVFTALGMPFLIQKMIMTGSSAAGQMAAKGVDSGLAAAGTATMGTATAGAGAAAAAGGAALVAGGAVGASAGAALASGSGVSSLGKSMASSAQAIGSAVSGFAGHAAKSLGAAAAAKGMKISAGASSGSDDTSSGGGENSGKKDGIGLIVGSAMQAVGEQLQKAGERASDASQHLGEKSNANSRSAARDGIQFQSQVAANTQLGRAAINKGAGIAGRGMLLAGGFGREMIAAMTPTDERSNK